MIYKKRPDLDIILDIINTVLAARPDSTFVNSLKHQYIERGSLSKKQLQGLYSKAEKVPSVQPSHLASLEAVILKMPNRFKSNLPESKPLYVKDETVGKLIEGILSKYPQHKRVVFLKSKFDNNETLSATEVSELKKLSKLL